MALRAWLASRQPPAPDALQARLAVLVDAHPEWEGVPLPDAMLAAGEELLQAVIAAPSKDRRSALDLLAADACVTYAFEAAADEPSRLVELAESSMQRIARVAAGSGSRVGVALEGKL